MKIGKYRIHLGRYFWLQTHNPVKIWHFPWLWIAQEVSSEDIDIDKTDKKPRFQLPAVILRNNKTYRYAKADKDINIKHIQ